MKRAKSALLQTLSLAAVLFGFAQAATIDVLTQKDVLLSIDFGDGRVKTVEFNKNGKYRTSDGAHGRWEVQGEYLCTYRDKDSNQEGRAGVASCGTLPADKNLGDIWEMPKANGALVTVSIISIASSSKN